MNLLAQFTSLFAPDDCLACGREGTAYCAVCLSLLPGLPGRCFRCRAKITTGVVCVVCIPRLPLIAATAVTRYHDGGELLVVALKFQANRGLAYPMACVMAPLLPTRATVLVPVPATNQHVRQRGYDQAELIARQLSHLSNLPVQRALIRAGNSHQLGANRATRLQQLTASLAVRHAEKINGQHIVLIDDVLTTGTTLTVAAIALLQARAASVSAVTFAQAV